MPMKLYQYPNCSTCRKAVKFLTEKGIAFDSIDITKQPPSQAELQIMLSNYDGDIRKLFNTSGMQYRQLNMKELLPNMSSEQAIELLSGNGKLIKRPFLLDGDKGIVAFKETLWAEFV
ncbi:MAG: Spx/MgsR family transcriptional regulator [Arenicella sp.]|jgi:Spx/MgsR family transcriptional regulator